MTKDVADCALFSLYWGHDSKDSTSVDMASKDYMEYLTDNVRDSGLACQKNSSERNK
jgi:hypothetical protein